MLLGLLIVVTTQLVDGMTLTTIGSRKRIDSDSTSRTVLNIMGNDFARMVQRTKGDVDYLFTKSAGNDSLFFYSEAPGQITSATLSEKSNVSLAGYRIREINAPNGSKLQLERLGKALTWSQINVVFHSAASGAAGLDVVFGTVISGTDDYHVVSEDVFRFEFCFMTQSGGYFEPANTWKPWADDNNDGIPNIKDVNGILVTIACLDQTSRSSLKDMRSLAAALPSIPISTDPNAPTTDLSKLPAAVWKQKIESPDFASQAGVPQLTAGAVRVYQRVFYLNGSSATAGSR